MDFDRCQFFLGQRAALKPGLAILSVSLDSEWRVREKRAYKFAALSVFGVGGQGLYSCDKALLIRQIVPWVEGGDGRDYANFQCKLFSIRYPGRFHSFSFRAILNSLQGIINFIREFVNNYRVLKKVFY